MTIRNMSTEEKQWRLLSSHLFHSGFILSMWSKVAEFDQKKGLLILFPDFVFSEHCYNTLCYLHPFTFKKAVPERWF